MPTSAAIETLNRLVSEPQEHKKLTEGDILDRAYWIFQDEKGFVQNIYVKTPSKKNKFNARQAYYKGRIYASLREAKFCHELDIKKARGIIKDYRVQCNFPIVINGILVCTMRLDYVVLYADGKNRYVDTKGINDEGEAVTATSVFYLKKKLVEAYYGITIELL